MFSSRCLELTLWSDSKDNCRKVLLGQKSGPEMFMSRILALRLRHPVPLERDHCRFERFFYYKYVRANDLNLRVTFVNHTWPVNV